MKSIALPVFAALVLLVATVSIVRSQPHRQLEPPDAAPPRSQFENRVAAVGLVEASSENFSLSAELPGVVDKVYVKVGQDVKAGDPLVKLDTRALEAARLERQNDLAVRKAEVESVKGRAAKARAALAEARNNLRFAEGLQDVRGISAEELSHRRSAVDMAQAELTSDEADIASAEAAVNSAAAALNSVETDLARSVITAPMDARVLLVKIHPGEYAPAGLTPQPWLMVGQVTPLNVRVDIDEHEAWRVKPGAPAVAQVRGDANLSTPARFVRFEPYVTPKQSLTGDSTERVDTRVLQAIYQIERSDLPLFVGQQMDVFIQADDVKTAALQHNSQP